MKMKLLQVYFISFFCGLYAISVPGNLQDLLQQIKPCIKTKQTPKACNTTLAESFTPKSPNVANLEPRTRVFLFTQKSPDVAEALHECGGRLPPCSTYDPDAYTEIFIHGYLDGVCRTTWMRESKEQFFLRALNLPLKYNVILFDWTWGNVPRNLAVHNCKIVGEQVGFVINNIMQQKGIGPEKFHIIGHSLGAIAAGFAGRSVPNLRRITCLDPSNKPFKNEPPNQKVTYRDAKIVDVIHTNSIEPSGNGDPTALGHADFYPNGGAVQISCYSYRTKALAKGDIFYATASLDPNFCYHLQAIQYFKVSINPQGCEFVGLAADSYEDFMAGNSDASKFAAMGMDYELYHKLYYKNDGERRKYYLTTTNECPYYDDSYLKNKTFPFDPACKVCRVK